MIDSFSSGKMMIDGKLYRSDLKILSNHKVIESWWRKEVHLVDWEDVEDLIDEDLELIIFGTGIPGKMKPTKNLLEKLKSADIEYYIAPTQQAVVYYNQHNVGKYTAVCFHLTC